MKNLKWTLTRNLPKQLNNGSLEQAVLTFVKQTQKYGQGIDPKGQFLQILNYITSACVKTHDGSGGDFWLSLDEKGDVNAFALAHFDTQIDNRLTYVVTHGWFREDMRDVRELKNGWRILEDHARQQLARHITLVTDRNSVVFNRILGDTWHPYVTILKKDLEE